jgi:hypothetical protein
MARFSSLLGYSRSRRLARAYMEEDKDKTR